VGEGVKGDELRFGDEEEYGDGSANNGGGRPLLMLLLTLLLIGEAPLMAPPNRSRQAVKATALARPLNPRKRAPRATDASRAFSVDSRSARAAKSRHASWARHMCCQLRQAACRPRDRRDPITPRRVALAAACLALSADPSKASAKRLRSTASTCSHTERKFFFSDSVFNST